MTISKKLSILGIRGIPAKHGGFETFAESLAIFLVNNGWEVTVYCQEECGGKIYKNTWHNINLIHIPVAVSGAKGTALFDLKCTLHAIKKKNLILTLGYNTALFCVFYRILGMKNIINMDGIEWRRPKWSFFERCWLYINEKMGAWLGNHLVADHPEIKNHLSKFVSKEKISVIPYGGDVLTSADHNELKQFNLKQKQYIILIARPEPENSILEIVRAYSRKERNVPLVILGNFAPNSNEYHRLVMAEASKDVKFLGAIYTKKTIQALRYFALFYIHGHTVGGTNPSLVEALGAGSAVLAHDNIFNRWVAGEGASYFISEDDCANKIETLLQNEDLIVSMGEISLKYMKMTFTWDIVHQGYENLLLEQLFLLYRAE